MDRRPMTGNTLCLGVVQPRTIRPAEAANVERAVTYARQAAEKGAQIVAFPECYPGPYCGPVDYSATEALGTVARKYGIYVAYGFMEPTSSEGAVDGFYNVYQVLGPDGAVLGRYAKTIPSPVDSELSNKRTLPGDKLVVVETPWARVGLLICWEAWFPQLCRTLAMRGADLILFPTGGMLYHLAPVWANLIQARATENLIYTASCINLFGVEDGFAHICAPEGRVASMLEEGVLVADLDLDRLRYLRTEDETLSFPKFYKTIPGLWRHDRPDLYQPAAWPDRSSGQ
jgi:predicted amidohydrolase